MPNPHLVRRFTSAVRSNAWPLLIGLTVFAALALLGLALYNDYGLSWDEPTQVDLGLQTYRYVMKADDSLLSWRDRSYGPFFEILLVMAQSKGPSLDLYLSRHLLTFLFFAAGAVGFFWLARRFLRSTGFALLGVLLLALSPRIFADAFYNTKDIPFLALYAFSLLTLFRLVDAPDGWSAGLHGLFSAALVATRLPGLFIPALTVAVLMWEAFTRRIVWRRALLLAGFYALITAGLTILFWPALWPNPPAEFLTALQMMGNFPHETQMLYLGRLISSLDVPWHYIPVWIGVTTPLTYLLFFAIGLIGILAGWLRGRTRLRTPEFHDQAIILAALFVPLLAVVALHSTLYDGWRQLFFLYVPLALIAAAGLKIAIPWLQERLPRPVRLWIPIAILLFTFLPTAVWMVSAHPYQNVYFNRLAGRDLQTAQQRFPLDYWGLSYREGLAYLLQADPSAQIDVYAETEAGQRSAAIFPTAQETRLHFVHTLAEADYFVGNYASGAQVYPFHNELYTVQVGNARILSVFHLNEEEKR